MSAALLSEEQRETLQEITNIGMGQAGAAIAKVLREFVKLSIPRISSVAAPELPQEIARMVGEVKVIATRQAFFSQFRGEAITVFPVESAKKLDGVLGYDDVFDHAAETELLLDVGNVLVGACLSEIARVLGFTIGFSAPSLMADHVETVALFRPEEIASKCALLVEVHFNLEEKGFSCHLIALMPEQELAALRAALDDFLSKL